MTLFKNKYRIESARLKNWNYANAGAYFITICSKNREHYFGEIMNVDVVATQSTNPVETQFAKPLETQCIASLPRQMQLSEIGRIVETEWTKTPDIRPDMNLTLGEFVVMPNHFHGIIIIGENEFNNGNQSIADVADIVETQCIASPPNNAPPNMALGNETPDMASLRGPQRKNLASIIRGFKSAVTKQARIVNPAFAWQERFHDHVIRNYEEYLRIENYIINNPKNWKADKFYKS